MLWFDDERGYNATYESINMKCLSCGLMMKEDIAQLNVDVYTIDFCCGLMMKEDITQLSLSIALAVFCCGLMMKENITQLKKLI